MLTRCLICGVEERKGEIFLAAGFSTSSYPPSSSPAPIPRTGNSDGELSISFGLQIWLPQITLSLPQTQDWNFSWRILTLSRLLFTGRLPSRSSMYFSCKNKWPLISGKPLHSENVWSGFSEISLGLIPFTYWFSVEMNRFCIVYLIYYPSDYILHMSWCILVPFMFLFASIVGWFLLI